MDTPYEHRNMEIEGIEERGRRQADKRVVKYF
jgi:hypothetical protein